MASLHSILHKLLNKSEVEEVNVQIMAEEVNVQIMAR